MENRRHDATFTAVVQVPNSVQVGYTQCRTPSLGFKNVVLQQENGLSHYLNIELVGNIILVPRYYFHIQI